MNSGTGIYKSGVLAFFAGAILIGALLGAVSFCFISDVPWCPRKPDLGFCRKHSEAILQQPL